MREFRKDVSAYAKRAYKTYHSELRDRADTSSEDDSNEGAGTEPVQFMHQSPGAEDALEEAIKNFGFAPEEKGGDGAHAVPGLPFHWDDGASDPNMLPSRGLWLNTFQRLFEVAFPFSYHDKMPHSTDELLADNANHKCLNENVLRNTMSNARQLIVESEVSESLFDL